MSKAGAFVADHEHKTSGVHGAVGNIVDTSSVQTLTNKLIDGATITNSTLGAGTFTLVDATTSIVDNADPTKVMKVELGSQTTGTTITATPPDSSFIFNSTDTAQTITGAKTYGSAGAVGKLKVAGTTSGSTILDATAVASGTLTLPAATDTLVGRGTTDTFTGVKTFGSAGAVGKLAIAGTTSGSTVLNATGVASGTLTLPAATDTLVALATTDTLTNKTLTAPVLSGTVTGTYTLGGTPTITSPTINNPSLGGTVTMGAASANAGCLKVVSGLKAALANTVATNILLVTVPTGTQNGMLTITAGGALGDGDSEHTGTYNVAISRVGGAVTKVGISAIVGTVKTTGATGDSTLALTVSAVTGAGGATNTFNVLASVTRSAGVSDNHTCSFTATLIQNTDGGWLMAAA